MLKQNVRVKVFRQTKKGNSVVYVDEKPNPWMCGLASCKVQFYVNKSLVSKHIYPVVPRIGESWKVPAGEYEDGYSGRVTLRILDACYEWYRDDVWFLEVVCRCEIEEFSL